MAIRKHCASKCTLKSDILFEQKKKTKNTILVTLSRRTVITFQRLFWKTLFIGNFLPECEILIQR